MRQRDRGTQVHAGRFPTDEDPVGAEIGTATVEHLAGDRDAVVGSSWPRKLGCFAVLDRYDNDIERPCEHLIRDVHHRGGTGDHPAAMEVQIHRAWCTVGADHPAGDSGDLDRLRLGHGERDLRHRFPCRGDLFVA